MPQILLVEDDITIAHMLTAYLEREGFGVTSVIRGDEAETIFLSQKFDLVILDINLPEVSGLELLPQFRNRSKVPILMLSARAGEDDKVLSLELGADDYIEKPFSARELIARVNRHLSRSQSHSRDVLNLQTGVSAGSVQLFPDRYQIFVSGNEVHVTKTEFEILLFFIKHIGGVVERDVLMKKIIGYDRYLSDRTLDTHIKNIRKKFEGFLTIETVRAIGYRLCKEEENRN